MHTKFINQKHNNHVTSRGHKRRIQIVDLRAWVLVIVLQIVGNVFRLFHFHKLMGAGVVLVHLLLLQLLLRIITESVTFVTQVDRGIFRTLRATPPNAYDRLHATAVTLASNTTGWALFYFFLFLYQIHFICSYIIFRLFIIYFFICKIVTWRWTESCHVPYIPGARNFHSGSLRLSL